jgi:hypothetical protein
MEEEMIKISFEVQNINYENCFENLIRLLIEGCRANSDPAELEKLIIRLGDDTVPVLEKLLGFLDTDTRDQLIVWLVEKQQDVIVDSANKALHDMLGGDAIIIGTIYAKDHPGTKISLHAAQVRTDSTQLVDSPALTGIIGGVAKLAFMFTDPGTVEKDVIKLLSSDYVKSRIISTLSESLDKAGLPITFSDIVVKEDSGEKIVRMTDPDKDEGLLPDAIEDKIIDALVAWLKQTI